MDDKEMIKKTIQHYIDGAREGKGELMKPAFHDDATIFGYIGPDLFAGPIQKLFDWNDENGAASNIKTDITSIDVEEASRLYDWKLITGLVINLLTCSHY